MSAVLCALRRQPFRALLAFPAHHIHQAYTTAWDVTVTTRQSTGGVWPDVPALTRGGHLVHISGSDQPRCSLPQCARNNPGNETSTFLAPLVVLALQRPLKIALEWLEPRTVYRCQPHAYLRLWALGGPHPLPPLPRGEGPRAKRLR